MEDKYLKLEQEIGRFRIAMLHDFPFYGDILLRTRIISDSKRVDTAGTDGRSIFYSPDYLLRLSAGQRNFVIMHEVYHILLLHWKRSGEKNFELWNEACDYVVNALLDRLKIKMKRSGIPFERPYEGCYLDTSDPAPAEEYYAMLLKNESSEAKKRRFRPKDLMPAALLSPAEQGSNELEIKAMVEEVSRIRGIGDARYIPRDFAGLPSVSPLPWKTILRDFLSERYDEDSSYLTPERKYLHMDIIMAGYSKSDEELGTIWAFVDTSASIRDHVLKSFIDELTAIADSFSCIINLAYWDTKVSSVYKGLKNSSDIKGAKPHHTGGTDINCVYAYLEQNGIRPEIMLILTDGMFGRLSIDNRQLRKRTILVINGTAAGYMKHNEIGRLAVLSDGKENYEPSGIQEMC